MRQRACDAPIFFAAARSRDFAQVRCVTAQVYHARCEDRLIFRLQCNKDARSRRDARAVKI